MPRSHWTDWSFWLLMAACLGLAALLLATSCRAPDAYRWGIGHDTRSTSLDFTSPRTTDLDYGEYSDTGGPSLRYDSDPSWTTWLEFEWTGTPAPTPPPDHRPLELVLDHLEHTKPPPVTKAAPKGFLATVGAWPWERQLLLSGLVLAGLLTLWFYRGRIGPIIKAWRGK